MVLKPRCPPPDWADWLSLFRGQLVQRPLGDFVHIPPLPPPPPSGIWPVTKWWGGRVKASSLATRWIKPHGTTHTPALSMGSGSESISVELLSLFSFFPFPVLFASPLSSFNHSLNAISGSLTQAPVLRPVASNPLALRGVIKDVNHVNHLKYFPDNFSPSFIKLSSSISQDVGIKMMKIGRLLDLTESLKCCSGTEFGDDEILHVYFSGNSKIFGKGNILESFIPK